MHVIEVYMCSNEHHLFIIAMVCVNINGERHSEYSILGVRYFLTLPTDLVNEVSAVFSMLLIAFIALCCEFITIQWRLVTSRPLC
jgi:uncharacterized protein with PQ loop repeat